jgi:hypothetical protein
MTRDPLSVRLPSDTLRRGRERAAEYGEPLTSTMERYVEEGLRRDRHPLITFVDGPSGRRARLAGTGPDVWEVALVFADSDRSADAAAASLSMPLQSVQAALGYYADYQEEVDGFIRANEEAAEREYALAQRVRELSGRP